MQAAILSQPFDIRAIGDGDTTLLDVGAYAKDLGFLVLVSRPQWLAANGGTARSYLRAHSTAVDWLYDPANRDEAVDILARNTKLPHEIAERTYDYYAEVRPFSPKMAIRDSIVQGTRQALVDLGDLKPASTRKFVDPSFAP